MQLPSFWRNALTQIILVGFLAFCCPGMFNALNGLGKAGGKNADSGNAANAALYGCFAVFGYFGGAFFNIFGNKVLMVVGGMSYAIYAGGIYISANVDNVGFVAVLSGAILGFGAGWFWTAQGAMMMAYATPEKKGTYITIFWVLFNIGGMFGGILTMAINWNNTADGASPASYFVFVSIMAIGALGALLLAHPSTVIREDGESVGFEKGTSALEEIKGALMVVTNKNMLLLTPLFLASNWFYAYQFNAVNGSLFNMRTRGFNSALYWGFQMLGAYVIGLVVDRKYQSTKRRAWSGFATFGCCLNFAFILGAVLQYSFFGGGKWDKVWDADDGKWIGPFENREIDFTETSRAAFPIIVYILYGLGDAMLQSYAYWIMANIAGPDTTLCARFAGYYKGVQSLGACVSWIMDLYVPYTPQFWTCWGLLLFSMPMIAMCINNVHDDQSNDPAGKQDSLKKIHSLPEVANPGMPSDIAQPTKL